MRQEDKQRRIVLFHKATVKLFLSYLYRQHVALQMYVIVLLLYFTIQNSVLFMVY
jgi:hypothetical protein